MPETPPLFPLNGQTVALDQTLTAGKVNSAVSDAGSFVLAETSLGHALLGTEPRRGRQASAQRPGPLLRA